MPGSTWFHGGPSPVSAIDPAKIGRGNDQYGPGFYLTDSEELAESYALRHHEGHVSSFSISGLVPLRLARPLPLEAIASLIWESPLRDEILENFGEVGTETMHGLARRAASAYAKMDALAAVNALANDFYAGGTHPFCDRVHKATGCTGVVISHDGIRTLSLWDAASARPMGARKVGGG